jgi:molybdopterin-guanine dinucleotide biosynthesis protein B
MMVVVVAIVAAGRGRGKTTLAESLTRQFSKNLHVWTVKHVSKSFDIEDKDSWRHMAAGAEGTIVVAPDRLVVLRTESDTSPETAIGQIPKDTDLVIVEGFRESGYPKILVAVSKEEAEEQLGRIRGIIAISGPIADSGARQPIQGVPVMSAEELAGRLASMLQEDQVKRLPGINCKKCGYPNCRALAEAILSGKATIGSCKTLSVSDLLLTVDGTQVYLSEFPKSFVKNVILGMVGSLKGVTMEKAKRIVFDIRL